jgi:4-amino-4-deoxy-L-arabinose transferase-like glycosyltransferase
MKFKYINNIKTKQLYDFETYHEIASNIYNHLGHTLDGWPIAFQGMGYPTTLGFVYKVVGNDSMEVAKNFNVILSILTLIIIYFITVKLSDDKFIIYGTYTMVAFLPNYIAYNNVVGTEVYFTFLFSLLILSYVLEYSFKFKLVIVGFLVGILTLTKPFFMVYPIVLGFIDYLKDKDMKKSIIYVTSGLIIMAMIVCPWTYRNYKKFGRIIPVSYNSGYVMYINNNDYNTKGAWMPLLDVPNTRENKEKIEDILSKKNVKIAPEIEPTIKKTAKNWIVNNKIEFLKLGTLRLNSIFYTGSWDIDAWTKNEEKVKDFEEFTKEEQSYMIRNNNFHRSFRDIIIYILSSMGIIYALFSIKLILQGLINKKYRVSSIILIPSLNTLFFMSVYFVYEGQCRYNFPLLFLFVIGFMNILSSLNMKEGL